METQGGVGKAAEDFVIETGEKKRQRSCSLSKACKSVANLSLIISLSLQPQRLNSAMFLQRLPREKILEVKDIDKLESAKKAAITEARFSLNMKTDNEIKVTCCFSNHNTYFSNHNTYSGDLKGSSMEETKQPKEDWENVRWEDTEWGAAPYLDSLSKLSQLPEEDETKSILNRDSLPAVVNIHPTEKTTEPTELYTNTTDKRAERFTIKANTERGKKSLEDNSTNGLSL